MKIKINKDIKDFKEIKRYKICSYISSTNFVNEFVIVNDNYGHIERALDKAIKKYESAPQFYRFMLEDYLNDLNIIEKSGQLTGTLVMNPFTPNGYKIVDNNNIDDFDIIVFLDI